MAEHCSSTKTPLRLECYEALLTHAYHRCDGAAVERVYEALSQPRRSIRAGLVRARGGEGEGEAVAESEAEGAAEAAAEAEAEARQDRARNEGEAGGIAQLGEAVARFEADGHGLPSPSPEAVLRTLARTTSAQARVALCEAALAEACGPSVAVVLQAALALVVAASGEASASDDAAAWLERLHAEGVDFAALDSSGLLDDMVDGLARTEAHTSLASLLAGSSSLRKEALSLTADEMRLDEDARQEQA